MSVKQKIAYSLMLSSGIDQLKKILDLTGTPNSTLVKKMQSKDVGHQMTVIVYCRNILYYSLFVIIVMMCLQAQSYVRSLPVQKKKAFKEVFSGMDPTGMSTTTKSISLL